MPGKRKITIAMLTKLGAPKLAELLLAVQLNAIKSVAEVFHIQTEIFEVRSEADAEAAFVAAGQRQVHALVMLPSPFVGANTKILAAAALKQRLPSVAPFPDFFAHDGGLIAYGPNLLAFFHQAGIMAGKVLKGTRPGDIPIETPTKFEFVLNLKTAKQLGLNIPPSILLRADNVIE